METRVLRALALPSTNTAAMIEKPGIKRASLNASLPKVLVIAPSIRIMGGQAVVAQQLLSDFASSGIDADFLPINPKPPGPLAMAERVKYLRTIVVSICYVFSLLSRVPKYDVIHIFSASYLSFIIAQTPAILISRMYGKKIVLNYHSGECDDHLNRWGSIVYAILRRVDRIVVQSEYLKQVFAKHGFQSVAIANVVDVRAFPFAERKEFQPKILVPRMLDSIYNVECSIRAFAIVKREFPNAQLTILGDGPKKKSLQQMVADLGVSNVQFLGRVERHEIARVFSAHHIFLNSSNIDNMPVSVLEAFASGLPVVTTRAGGIPWMIEDRVTGHLASLNDHEELASRIQELLTDQQATHRLVAAAHQELEKYRWPVVEAKWRELYSSLSCSAGETA